MVPREVCTERSERSNHYREVMLSVQKSAEVIVAVFFQRRTESIGVFSTTGKGGMSRMGTENRESCSQRDSAERKGYVRAHRSFNRIWKERDSAEPDTLGKILEKDNLNRAYKRVKANKGAPGVDGMTIEAALPWLKEHNYELTERIRRGSIPRLLSDGWRSRSRTEGAQTWHPNGH